MNEKTHEMTAVMRAQEAKNECSHRFRLSGIGEPGVQENSLASIRAKKSDRAMPAGKLM